MYSFQWHKICLEIEITLIPLDFLGLFFQVSILTFWNLNLFRSSCLSLPSIGVIVMQHPPWLYCPSYQKKKLSLCLFCFFFFSQLLSSFSSLLPSLLPSFLSLFLFSIKKQLQSSYTMKFSIVDLNLSPA